MKPRTRTLLISLSAIAWITVLVTQYLLIRESYSLASAKVLSEKWLDLSEIITPADSIEGPQEYLEIYTEQLAEEIEGNAGIMQSFEGSELLTHDRKLNSMAAAIDSIVLSKFGDGFEYGAILVSLAQRNDDGSRKEPQPFNPNIGNKVLGNLTDLKDAMSRGTISAANPDLQLTARVYFRDQSIKLSALKTIVLELILAVISFLLLTTLLIWTLSKLTRLQSQKGEHKEHLDGLKHTFDTPIRTIQSASADQMRMLAEGDLEGAKRMGSYVHAQAARLKQIVAQLQDKTLDDLKNKLNIRKTSLALLFEHCVEDMKIKYAPDPVNVSVTIHPPDLEVMADPYYLKIAILNVLDNSFLYNPDRDELFVEITASQAHDQVRIRIADNGMGVDHDEISHLGSKYYRSPQHRDQSGLGLGLYQVRQIVKAHEGRVKFQGDTTAGLSVQITLPMSN